MILNFYSMEVSIKSLDGQNKKFEAVPLDYTVRQFKDLIFDQMVCDIFMNDLFLVIIKISMFLSFSRISQSNLNALFFRDASFRMTRLLRATVCVCLIF